jgi:haloalkane dehalogenase
VSDTAGTDTREDNTKDFAFKNDALRRWEHVFLTHHTHRLEGAGHFLQDDAADEVCRSIRDWWPPTCSREG